MDIMRKLKCFLTLDSSKPVVGVQQNKNRPFYKSRIAELSLVVQAQAVCLLEEDLKSTRRSVAYGHMSS